MTADELKTMAIESYFGSVARGDADTVAGILADNAVMRIVSAGITYDGKRAIIDHFDDFLSVYDRIGFADFVATADQAAQRVAVQFTITLENAQERIVMTNCNFFQVNAEGLVEDVAIYMSGLPDKGF